MIQKPQSQFPLLKRYKAIFEITPQTIFAYGGGTDNPVIYCDYELTEDLIVHEEQHFKQQADIGLDKWVTQYLINLKFRLLMEIDSYSAQIKSIKDRNQRTRVWLESAKQLASSLYGNLVSLQEAKEVLK